MRQAAVVQVVHLIQNSEKKSPLNLPSSRMTGARGRRWIHPFEVVGLVVLCSLSASVVAAAEVKPITPAEAAKKVNEKVVVEMEVKSTGGRENHYLNSEEDFKDAKNFTVFISKDLLEKFKKAGVENPSTHYKGKLIQVSGTVVLEKEKPWIKVEDPEQIKIMLKEKK